MGSERRVDAIKVGDWIDHEPYFGEIDEVRPHGRKIGDGTVDWFTFRVREPGDTGGGMLPYTTAMGPHRADAMLLVIEKPDDLDRHPYPPQCEQPGASDAR